MPTRRSRRRLLVAAATGTLGAVAGCNSPANPPVESTPPPDTVEVTDHYVCLLNRDDEPVTVSVSIDAAGEGDGIGFQTAVPAETAETRTGIVPGYGQYDVTVRVRSSEFGFGWSVDRESVTSVRVEVGPESVVVASGVTGDCEL